MTRVNVTGVIGSDEFDQPTIGVVGWFDVAKATDYHEATMWDGNNNISNVTGSQWEHELLYRTAKGRWVLHSWSQYTSGNPPAYHFVEADTARQWLIAQEHDEAVTEHFGELEDERGPGRPEVGGPIHVRLGDLVPKLDAWAIERCISRAEAVRQIVSARLTGSSHV